jgi:hypothetical protein
MPREHYWLAKWSPRQEPRGLRATAVPGGLTPSPQNFDQKLKNVSNCSRTALERFDMPECTTMETV